MENKLVIKNKNGSHKELGASLVEYGLFIALIAVIAIPSLQVLGQNIKANTENLSDALAQGTIHICPDSDPD